jgi:hypothetical protein
MIFLRKDDKDACSETNPAVVMASILVLVSGFWILNVRQWHSDGPQSAEDQVYAAVIRARL